MLHLQMHLQIIFLQNYLVFQFLPEFACFANMNVQVQCADLFAS